MKVKHGKTGTPEYYIWESMIGRCHNPANLDFHNYGGRGIVVCSLWRESFAAFLADVGPRPSPKYSIDRYPAQGGNYEPGNARWATWIEQARNRRTNRLVTLDSGETLPAVELADRIGMSPNVLNSRLYSGWSVSRAILRPVGHYRKDAD